MKTVICFVMMGLLSSACGKKTEESKPRAPVGKPTSNILSLAATPSELIAMAVQADDLEALEVAIARDANLELILPNGATLLTYAISNNFPAIVEALLEAGADERKVDRNGHDPVLLAAQLHRHRILRLLVTHGADINTRDAQGRSLLMQVISREDQETAEWLIKMDADLDIVDLQGQTAPKMAKERGLTRLVRMIDLRVSLAGNQSNEQVLAEILKQTDVEALRLALARSPTILRLPMPTSALFQAIQGERLEEIHEMVQLILDHDLPPNGEPSDPRSPLAEASARGLTETIEILVKRGADIEYKDALGHTALIHAVRAKQPLSVIKLLDLNALKGYDYLMNDRTTRIHSCRFLREATIESVQDRERLNEIKDVLRCSGRRFSAF